MNKLRKFFLLFGVLCFIIACILLFNNNKQLQKANNIIEQQTQQIDKLTLSLQEKENSVNILMDENEKYKVSLEEKENELKTCKNDLAKKKLNKYRLTSYYPQETSNHTGSGLNTSDFQINEKGWYTYQGKLVLAAATKYGEFYTKIPGRHYFKYYDEIFLTIDGVKYEGIILDTCGFCSKGSDNARLDLFVSDKRYAIDRGYKGKNMIKVEYK